MCLKVQAFTCLKIHSNLKMFPISLTIIPVCLWLQILVIFIFLTTRIQEGGWEFEAQPGQKIFFFWQFFVGCSQNYFTLEAALIYWQNYSSRFHQQCNMVVAILIMGRYRASISFKLHQSILVKRQTEIRCPYHRWPLAQVLIVSRVA